MSGTEPEEVKVAIYEASWAPSDPRDALYDKTASCFDKITSVIKIVASFHPVLNALVLLGVGLCKVGYLGVFILGLLTLSFYAAVRLL